MTLADIIPKRDLVATPALLGLIDLDAGQLQRKFHHINLFSWWGCRIIPADISKNV